MTLYNNCAKSTNIVNFAIECVFYDLQATSQIESSQLSTDVNLETYVSLAPIHSQSGEQALRHLYFSVVTLTHCDGNDAAALQSESVSTCLFILQVQT